MIDYTQLEPVSVRFWGQRGCFTRPETRTERLSYPVPTPSALRGMLEAILFRPDFRWRVTEVWICRPINYFVETRNEVRGPSGGRINLAKPTLVDAERLQRHVTGLRDLDYCVFAHPVPLDDTPATRAKYVDMFRSRVRQGQCYARPCFGQREWTAYFSEIPEGTMPAPITMHAGRVLFGRACQKNGSFESLYFEAVIINGVLKIPQHFYAAADAHPEMDSRGGAYVH